MERKPMKVTIVGAGSTRTPALIGSIIKLKERFPVKKLVFYDIDMDRVEKMRVYMELMMKTHSPETELVFTGNKDEAYKDIDFVFCQMRVGGSEYRSYDEKIPLKYGIIGQETCGPGGFAYGMRSIGDMIEMVKLGQKTENLFIGVNSGIMDQFAVGMGKKDNAVLLDCNTLKYEYVPVLLKDEVIIISNTNKRRGLADSKYNERRSECEQALKELQEKLHIKALGELSIEEFEKNKELIKNETNRKRAKHAVYENQRTLKAQKELTKGNLEEFGKLMNESHISLRDDYEVTGKELDTLVELSWKQDGTVGSRMTGAGFGGCTVSIVKKDKAEEFIKNVGKGYRDKIGYDADFYIVEVSEGPREL